MAEERDVITEDPPPSDRADTGSASDESAKTLLADLSRQMTTLVQQEVRLAKAEMGTKASSLGKGVGMLVGALIVAVLGLGVLAAAAVAGLGESMPVWGAALIVGGVLLVVVAGPLALIGKNSATRAVPPAPTETIDSAKEDVAWLKTQTTSARK